MPKNVQTTTQLHTFHMLVRSLKPSGQTSTVCEVRTSDVLAGFRKGRGTRDEIAKIHWIIEEAKEFQKKICFCFIDYGTTFDCVDHNKLENF